MKFFIISPATLKDLYERITENRSSGPDGIDPAVTALIAAWEAKVSKTIRGAQKLLRSKKKDHGVISKYILIMKGDVNVIKKTCIPRTHPVYKKLIEHEDELRQLSDHLQAKIQEKKP